MDEACCKQGLEMLLCGNKNPLYDYATKKWVVSSPGFLDALNFVKQVYNPSNLLGPTNDIALSTQAADTIHQQLMPQGKLAIDIDGSWASSISYSPDNAPWPHTHQTMGVARTLPEFDPVPTS